MYGKIIRLFFVLFAVKFLAQDKVVDMKGVSFQWERIIEKRDTIFILRNSTSEIPKPTLLFLHGSLPVPLLFKDEKDIFPNIPFDYKELSKKWNIILIARKGVPLVGKFPDEARGVKDLNGNEPLEYRKNNHIFYRVWQANTVIDYLYRQKYVDKKKIYVLGHSEGYRVGVKLAVSTNKIAKIILANTSPFSRTIYEIYEAQSEAVATKKYDEVQKKIDSIVSDYQQYEDDIEKYRSNYDIYGWLSYEKNPPLLYLDRIKIPFLIIGGTKDLRSSQNQFLPFLVKNQKMQIKMFPGYDHNFFKDEWDAAGKPLESSYHWDDVFQYCYEWLLK